MSGPSVSSGPDSKQDYQTPREFIAAVEKRFGKIQFDLAAVAANAQHERYFAPDKIIEVIGKGKKRQVIVHPHHDPKAYGHDAFKHDWSQLTRSLPSGILWLNCEFGDIPPWAGKCRVEGHRGAEITLLTPASVGANWFRDTVAGVSDTYLLNGRMSFDGKNVYPKDCMLSHWHPAATGLICVWDWNADQLHTIWKRC